MARRFPQLSFGPWGARPALRAVLSPGERIVGWCTAQAPTTLSRAFLHAALATMPGIQSALPGDRGLRLLVVTDRRVLLLAGGGKSPVAPWWACELERLRVQMSGRDRYDLAGVSDDAGVTLTVPMTGRGAAGRAIEALRLLARGGASPGTGDGAAAGISAEFARSSYGALPAGSGGSRR